MTAAPPEGTWARYLSAVEKTLPAMRSGDGSLTHRRMGWPRSNSCMPPRENPRRAYNRDGSVIEPPTLASMHAQGDITARIDCPACHRGAVIATDEMPGHWYFPDIPLHMRLTCSACKCRGIQIMLDMTAFYERDRARRGQAPDLPDSYEVVRLPMPAAQGGEVEKARPASLPAAWDQDAGMADQFGLVPD